MSESDPNHLRVSHEEREKIVSQLRSALDAGRIDLTDFDQRSRDVYAATSYDELNQVLADLPGSTPVTPPPSPYRYDPYGGSGPSNIAPSLPPHARYSPAQRQNGFGTASLVLGIVGFCCTPAAILAIVFGAIGLNKANQGLADNKSIATAGLILGIVGAALIFARIPFGWIF
jgi:hypothetical protein